MLATQITRDQTSELTRQALDLLDGHWAHLPFDDAVAEFPAAAINTRPINVTYTPWHLLEHLRIAQWDILEYVRNPGYVSPAWPTGYWPGPDATATHAEFDETVARFRADHAELRALVAGSPDLLALIPYTPGHSLLREVRLAAAHNAYHIGEFAILRQVMGTWPMDRPG
jgi:DinB superfamily